MSRVEREEPFFFAVESDLPLSNRNALISSFELQYGNFQVRTDFRAARQQVSLVLDILGIDRGTAIDLTDGTYSTIGSNRTAAFKNLGAVNINNAAAIAVSDECKLITGVGEVPPLDMTAQEIETFGQLAVGRTVKYMSRELAVHRNAFRRDYVMPTIYRAEVNAPQTVILLATASRELPQISELMIKHGSLI